MTGADIISKIKQYPIATVGFIAAVILAGAVYLRAGQIPQLETRKTTLQTEVTKIDTNLKNAIGLEQDVEKVTSLQKEIDSRLLDASQVAANQLYFYNLEQAAGVRLNLGALRQASAAKQFEGITAMKSYRVSTVDLVISGPYPNILDFLNRTLNGRFITRVDELNIATGQGPNQGSTEAKLRLEILTKTPQ